MEKIICPICGHEMVDKSAGGAIEVVCPNCGNGWATYENEECEELYSDETIYSLFLDKKDLTMADLSSLSKIIGSTALSLKKAIRDGNGVASLKAPDMKPILSSLSKESLPFHTVPDFPYNF